MVALAVKAQQATFIPYFSYFCMFLFLFQQFQPLLLSVSVSVSLLSLALYGRYWTVTIPPHFLNMDVYHLFLGKHSIAGRSIYTT